MLRFHNEERRLELGVHDLLSAGPQSGDLRMQVAWSAKTRMRQGQKIHSAYQASRSESDASFQKEVLIRQKLIVRGWEVQITGRIDGLCLENGQLIVEEIKSSTLPGEALAQLTLEKVPEWRQQVEVYLYFLASQGRFASGRIVMVSIVDGAIVSLPVEPNPATSSLIESKLDFALFEHERRLAWLSERSAALEAGLPFAHGQWRPGQLDMTHFLQQAISSGKSIFLSASTGYGKTASALYAALMEAYRTGKKVFYATARTTQQQMAEDTIEMMAERGLPVRAISIRARDKICLNSQIACHKDSCRFAQGYHDKIQSSDLIDLAWKCGNPSGVAWPDAIVEIAETHEICPFAFGMDLAIHADIVIGDYNYLYDPSIRLSLISNEPSEWICIVDEAHNLPDRAMDYGSPALSFVHAWIALEKTQFVNSSLAKPMHSLVDFIRRRLNLLRPGDESASTDLEMESRNAIAKIANEIEEVALEYALHQLKQPLFQPDEEDSWMLTARSVLRLKSVLDRAGDETLFIWKRSRHSLPELGLFAQPNKIKDTDVGLRLLCRDPSGWLGPIHSQLHAVLFMSATLHPYEFYRDMFGVHLDNCVYQHFRSPFPPEKRAAFVLPQVSTAFRDRDRDRAKTAALISQVIEQTPGNVAVYFPSFAFLSLTAPLLSFGDRKVMTQHRGMSELERHETLERMRRDRKMVLLAVLGGIFSEGVDLPGEALSCAIVVGPSLPQANLSRKLIASFYEERYGQGFKYGWLVPGMSRVAQAAGRVIRTPSDRGIVVLIGRRFLSRDYQDFIPKMWSLERSDNITESLSSFWGME